jgi:hypothetical protein
MLSFVSRLCIACSNDHSPTDKRARIREERPRTRISDPTLATKNELDREDSNRERALLRRARDGSDERTGQYVTVALSVGSSLLLARKFILTCTCTSPLLGS